MNDPDGEYRGKNIIFGGEAMSQMDLLAAATASELLRDRGSDCNGAVTWTADFKFHRPVGTGDLLKLTGSVESLEGKGRFSDTIREHSLNGRTIEIKVDAVDQNDSLFATANFCFITKKDGEYRDHKLN
jgi:acyl-CoA hydrolase